MNKKIIVLIGGLLLLLAIGVGGYFAYVKYQESMQGEPSQEEVTPVKKREEPVSSTKDAVVKTGTSAIDEENNVDIEEKKSPDSEVKVGDIQPENVPEELPVATEKKCDANQHLEGGECMNNTKSCELDNGVGRETWDNRAGKWGDCFITKCDEGFSEFNDQCIASADMECITRFEKQDIESLNTLSKSSLTAEQWCEQTQLDISGNNLTTIPDEVFKIQKLTTLDISDNNFTQFPTNLQDIVGLKELDISNNKLSKIPQNLTIMKQLESLLLDKNNIAVLDKNIQLPLSLKHLSLKNNGISYFPNAFIINSSLEHIGLEHNNISQLPRKVIFPSTLLSIGLKGNKLAKLNHNFTKDQKNEICEDFSGKTACIKYNTSREYIQLETCLASEHRINGKCVVSEKSCSIKNAKGKQIWDKTKNQWSDCSIAICTKGYHLEGTTCKKNTKSCRKYGILGFQYWDFTKKAWSDCRRNKIGEKVKSSTQCPVGEHALGKYCVKNNRVCNGDGTQSWNTKTLQWGKCSNQATSKSGGNNTCQPGYHSLGKYCVKNAKKCSNKYGYGTQQWVEIKQQWGGCVLTSCKKGYSYKDNYCHKITTSTSTQGGKKYGGSTQGNSGSVDSGDLPVFDDFFGDLDVRDYQIQDPVPQAEAKAKEALNGLKNLFETLSTNPNN